MTRTSERHPADAGRVARPGTSTVPWLVLTIAIASGALVWLVAAALGIDLVVRTGPGTRTVGLVPVVLAGLAAGLLGWAARALLRRVLPGGGRSTWLVLCGVVALVSLAGPLGAVSPAAMVVLVVEHLAVGLVVALGLAPARPRGQRVNALRA